MRRRWATTVLLAGALALLVGTAAAVAQAPLGAKRAKSVKDFLSTQGITGDRVSTISYGKELPLCQEESEPCWARNRRVHSVVLGQ